MMRYLTLACALAACGKHDDSKQAPAAKPAEAVGLTGLKVVADGKPVTMTSATLVHRSDDSLEIEVANNELPCDSARRSERWGVPKDDISFHATLASRLDGDGTRRVVIDRIGLATATNPSITIKGDQFAVDLVLDDSGAGVEHWKHLEVHGTVTPTKCGDAEIEKGNAAIAKETHASTATITVAGQKVPIVAATRRKGTTYLSTEPMTCAPYMISPRVTLAIEPETWRLEGGWIGGQISASGSAFTVKPGKTGSGADGPTVELALAGSTKSAGYQVELAGAIEALACKDD